MKNLIIILISLFLITSCCSWAEKNCVTCKKPIQILTVPVGEISETCNKFVSVLKDIANPKYYIPKENVSYNDSVRINLKVQDAYEASLRELIKQYKDNSESFNACFEELKKTKKEENEDIINDLKESCKKEDNCVIVK